MVVGPVLRTSSNLTALSYPTDARSCVVCVLDTGHAMSLTARHHPSDDTFLIQTDGHSHSACHSLGLVVPLPTRRPTTRTRARPRVGVPIRGEPLTLGLGASATWPSDPSRASPLGVTYTAQHSTTGATVPQHAIPIGRALTAARFLWPAGQPLSVLLHARWRATSSQLG